MQINKVTIHAQHEQSTEFLINLTIDDEGTPVDVNVITELSEGNHIPNTRFVDPTGNETGILILPISITAPPNGPTTRLAPSEDFIIDLHTLLDEQNNPLMNAEMERICS